MIAGLGLAPAAKAAETVMISEFMAANVTTLPNPATGITGPVAGVAVINGAGSITLQPGDKFILDNLTCKLTNS